MQVKISFTVDFEEVPKKVDEALIEALKLLEGVADGNLSPVTADNVTQKMKWIDSARKQLLRVDTRMLECYSILAGYNKAIAESYIPKTDEPPSQSEEQSNVDS